VTPPLEQLLAAVRSTDVEFATFRPEGSDFAILDRRVAVVAPPELAQLAAGGDRTALDRLVGLLRDPARAWAAQVVLAAMTRREEKEVEAFSGRPDEWWEAMGATAYERWAAWLAEHGDRLRWDPEARAFVSVDL
jgi:hypothetical protein